MVLNPSLVQSKKTKKNKKTKQKTPWYLTDFSPSQYETQGHFSTSHKLRLMRGRHKKLIGPFGIAPIRTLQAPSYELSFAKQVLPVGHCPGGTCDTVQHQQHPPGTNARQDAWCETPRTILLNSWLGIDLYSTMADIDLYSTMADIDLYSTMADSWVCE